MKRGDGGGAGEAQARPGPRGRNAIVGALIAVIGVLAAANPGNPVLRALHDAVPVLADTLPTLVTACGAVIAALSQPPRLGRQEE